LFKKINANVGHFVDIWIRQKHFNEY